MKEIIEVPSDVRITVENGMVSVEGPLGKVEKKLNHPFVEIKVEDNKVVLSTPRDVRKYKKMLYTYVAHIKNMIKGVKEGYRYKLAICYSHFPMNVKVEGDKVRIENFLGERAPRFAKILPGVKVEVKGKEIVVSGIDKEAVGQTAANIEKATYIRGIDRRIFQDGIYIVSKGE